MIILFIFVIVCGLEAYLCRSFWFVYISIAVRDPVIKRERFTLGFHYTGLTPPQFLPIPKQQPRFPASFVVVFFLYSVSSDKMRDDCSFCWYLWNWWQSLFKLSFHNKQTIKHWDKFESTQNNNTISIVNNNINIDNTSMISVAKWHLCLFCKQCFRQIVWISIRTNDWFICQAKKIHVWFLRYRHLYLRSMSFFQILKSVSSL